VTDTDAEAHIHSLVHPIADRIVKFYLGLDRKMLLAKLLQHRRQHWRERGLGADDAERPGDRVTRFLCMRERPFQGRERGEGLFEKVSAFFGDGEAARRAQAAMSNLVRVTCAGPV
jgi:hypothetical protein